MSDHASKPWIMICRDNVKFYMTDDEKRKYVNRRINSNRNWIVMIFADGTEVMMSMIIAVIPNPKFDGKLNKPTPKPAVYKPAKETTIDKLPDAPKPEPVVVEVPEVEETEKKESIHEKEQRLLKEMMARSSCTHEGLEVLHSQVTTKGTRFFPVCSFCGHRARYIKKDKLTDEEMANATPWVDRD
jgi:type IV secretory pathway VirB10-like protein